MSKQIHVLHVTYDMNIGGTEQVIRNLIEGTTKEHYRCSVLCLDGQIGPWGKALEEKGITHYCLSRRPGLDIEVIRQFRKLIKSENVDILHCHQYTPFTYGWFAKAFTGKPIIFTEHGRFYPDFGTVKRKLINPFLQRFTAAITSISKATKQALVTYENLSPHRIEVIYNGIMDEFQPPDVELRQSLAIDEKAVVFGTISRLDPIKNQTMMIRAFCQLWKEDKSNRLLIVGDGPLRQELEALVKALQLEDAVIFTGFQPNPKRYLSIIDVFLLPSLSEGTSMTLLEAMSYGKPTIATAVGGTPEIIEDNKTGVLIANKDEPSLVNAMKRLSVNESDRTELGKAAREVYLQRFTVSAMVQQYESVYRQCLKNA